METARTKVQVERERIVNTYAELWHGSGSLLKSAQEHEEGSFWTSMASLALTAFTFEAFLNHIGVRLFATWEDMESLSPMQKLSVLCERLNVNFDKGARPFQSLTTLVKFRNALAHGKTEKLNPKPTIEDAEKVAKSIRDDRPRTDWELLCSPEFASRAREDLKQVVEQLHGAAKIKDESPFMMGFTLRSASKVE
jgi:hypothetical protein